MKKLLIIFESYLKNEVVKEYDFAPESVGSIKVLNCSENCLLTILKTPQF